MVVFRNHILKGLRYCGAVKDPEIFLIINARRVFEKADWRQMFSHLVFFKSPVCLTVSYSLRKTDQINFQNPFPFISSRKTSKEMS